MKPLTDLPSRPPIALPGFRGIERHYDTKLQTFVARIAVGESYVTRHDETITTVLGSCICACIRDPVTGIGGMNHFMLPGGTSSVHSQATIVEQRFGVAAMESLINALLANGAQKTRLEVKVFGGAELLGGGGDRIGAQNASFVRQFLAREDLHIAADDCGGANPRRVAYTPKTGRVLVKYLPIAEARTDLDREATFARDIENRPPEGEIEIFRNGPG
ncbi:MAG: chemoreceptor glutamine deamidase CheD [Pseudomonadota bacterium]